jgi:hypothetical protein
MIPNGIVAVPTFRRTEMLALCLERISAAEESQDLDIRIFLDHSFPERLAETEHVRDEYCPNANIFHANPHILCPSGTWNILNSLRLSWETKAPLIFFIEEDVMIKPEFFKKHIEMQNSDDLFVSCGRKLSYFDDTFYSNPGTCYKAEKLALVIPHINDHYFSNQKAYIDHNFPPSPESGILDDGLIRHVMLAAGGKAKCAVPRIASHCGWHYYQKMPLYKNEGSLPDRIKWMRNFLSDIPARKREDPRYINDLEELA